MLGIFITVQFPLGLYIINSLNIMNKILLSVAEKRAIEEGIDGAFDDVKNI